MPMKKFFKIMLWCIASVVVICGILFVIAWRSPGYYILSGPPAPDSITPFREYDQISGHKRPYVFSTPGKFIVFGATHTRDPKDPQIQMIEREWQLLKPGIALVEGRLGFLIPVIMDPVKKLGEGGKVNALAKRDGIAVYNWDLSKEVLAKQLLHKFDGSQIAISQILSPYFGQLRFGKPSSPEEYIQPYLKRASFAGQEANFKTAADIDRYWKKYFPNGPDWRDVSDETALPGFLDEMMQFTNDLRNRQLVSAIKELTAKGERVFVICGSSHAACIAPAFKGIVMK